MKRRIIIALASPAILFTGCDSVPFFKRAPTSAFAETAVPEPLVSTAEDAPEGHVAQAAAGAVGSVNEQGGVVPAGPSDAPEPPLQLASADLPSAARRTMDAFMASLPNPAAARREKLARTIADFDSFPFAFDLPTVTEGPTDTHGWLSSQDANGSLLVVDIWATWCGPCRKAIPDFVAIQEEYESEGVQVVGITCDSADPAHAGQISRKAVEIGEQLGVNYPLLIDDGSTTKQVPGFRGYPTTLFVTPDGIVRYKVTGAQSKEALAEIVDVLLER